MNVPFVTFQCRDLKVFRVVYLQANRDFQIFITQARKNIFSCGFLHLVHLNEIFQNKFIWFLDPPDPLSPGPVALKAGVNSLIEESLIMNDLLNMLRVSTLALESANILIRGHFRMNTFIFKLWHNSIKSKLNPENALNFQQLLLNLMETIQQLSKWGIQLWKKKFGA